MRTVQQYDIRIEDTSYDDETTLHLRVRRSHVAPFTAAFTEALAGRGRLD